MKFRRDAKSASSNLGLYRLSRNRCSQSQAEWGDCGADAVDFMAAGPRRKIALASQSR